MYFMRYIKTKVPLNYFTRLVHLNTVINMSDTNSSDDKCKVAVCQLTSTNDKLRNLNIVKGLVEEAAKQNAQVKMYYLLKKKEC